MTATRCHAQKMVVVVQEEHVAKECVVVEVRLLNLVVMVGAVMKDKHVLMF